MIDPVDAAIAALEKEVAEMQLALGALRRLRGRGAVRPAKAPAKEAAVDKQPAPSASPSSGKPKRKQEPEAAAPLPFDPKIRGREHYVEVLRKLDKPKARADLVGSVPQRSKALNVMEREGLIQVEDGFVRITEAGELYLADADQ